MAKRVENPVHRFHTTDVEWDEGEAPFATLTRIEERAKSILSSNDSPDVGFRWSINPYRGCFHACAYCYARPSHTYLGYGAGTDFDRKIVIKINAVELLEAAFDAPSWRGESIVFSGNTDCYQPLEQHYRLTQGLLAVCLRYRNPVSIITKNAGILRDLPLLTELHREARCRVTVSIAFARDEDARALEPNASSITKRFETVRALASAGIPVGVSLGPTIPGLNDSFIPEILQRAKDAGADHAFTVLLRLPQEVLPVFEERLATAFPARHSKVMNAIREMHGGNAYESAFHMRQVGRGDRFRIVERLFVSQCERLGLEHGMKQSAVNEHEEPTTFRRPTAQLSLFS